MKNILMILLSSTILFAVTPTEFQEVESQYKMIDNSKQTIPPISFKTRKGVMKLITKKQLDDGLFVAPAIIEFNNQTIFNQDKTWVGISNYDIHNFSTVCYDKNNQMFAISVVKSSELYKKQKTIFYQIFMYTIDYKDSKYIQANYVNYDIFKKLFISSVQETDIPYNPKKFFPYYNEEKILARLYETGTCDKETTEKANILVLVNSKWIPQEQSWNIKKDETPNTINTSLTLKELFENSKDNKKVSIENLKEILNNEEINTKTLQKYNDIAYYLQQAGENQESAYLLEKIIEKFPDRTVAYFNLGDAYYGLGDKEKATQAYQTYIDLMKKKGWENKIPKRVIERVEAK